MAGDGGVALLAGKGCRRVVARALAEVVDVDTFDDGLRVAGAEADLVDADETQRVTVVGSRDRHVAGGGTVVGGAVETVGSSGTVVVEAPSGACPCCFSVFSNWLRSSLCARAS